MPTTTAPPDAERLEGLLTEAQLCRVFGRSKQTLRAWRQKRGLPHVIDPGDGRDTIRYRRDDVDQWAKKSKDEPWARRNGLELRAKWSELRRR